MDIETVEDIPTDEAGQRYIHVCQCRHHPNCDFTEEGLHPIIELCTLCDGACDSVRSRMYKPGGMTREKFERLPEEFQDAFREALKSSDILEPLREKLDV